MPSFRTYTLASLFSGLVAASPISPFVPQPSTSDGTVSFRLDRESLSLLESVSIGATMQIVLPMGKVLEMERFEVMDETAPVFVVDEQGEHLEERARGVHLRGHALHTEDLVHVSLSELGCYGLMQFGESIWTLSTPVEELHLPTYMNATRRSNLHHFSPQTFATLDDEAMQMVRDMSSILPETGLEIPGVGAREPTANSQNVNVNVGLEGDYSYTQKLGGNDQWYLQSLMAGVSTIFSKSNVPFRFTYSRLWRTGDPFGGNDLGQKLESFRQWYINTPHSNPEVLNRSMAQLLTTFSGGGLAYLNAVCDKNWGYGINGNIDGQYGGGPQDYNPNNWDVYVLAHESGHNVGSAHSHEYNPPIDRCDAGQCQRGDVMSYCHLCPGGVSNIRMGFDGRVQESMNSNLQRACGTCVDSESSCAAWAASGECQRNPGYMLQYCRRSCGVC